MYPTKVVDSDVNKYTRDLLNANGITCTLDEVVAAATTDQDIPPAQVKTVLHPVTAIAELLAMQGAAKRIYDQIAVLLTEPSDRKSWDMAMADLRKLTASCAAKVERLDVR